MKELINQFIALRNNGVSVKFQLVWKDNGDGQWSSEFLFVDAAQANDEYTAITFKVGESVQTHFLREVKAIRLCS